MNYPFSNPAGIFALLLFPLVMAACSESGPDTAPQSSYRQVSDKPLIQILDDAEFAITERNIRITSRLHIGQAIRDRNNPGYPDYEIILYCSLTFAKKMLELDPGLITVCPGRITVRSQGEKYLIEAPLWPEPETDGPLKTLMRSMNRDVMEIVDYAAEDWLDITDPDNPME